jgi:hypothetical protein
MVIDFHAHYPREENFVERLLELLPQVGIDRICLSSAGEYFGHASNDEVLDAALRHPDRITALALIKMMPACLDAVARAFPGLNIVGAHLGAPWHEEASMMARMHPNYYVDLTGAWWGGWRANKGPEFYRYHFFWEGL